MTNIKQLFQERDAMFASGTKAILESMIHVLDGIVEYLKIQDEADSGNLSWEDVSFFTEPGGEAFIMLVGVVTYKPGDKTTLANGEVVEVTAETVDYFRRLVRIGVPYDLADDGTVEDVIDFLELMEQQANEADIEEQELFEDLITKLGKSDDFDLTELSEEQRNALKLFSGMGGHKS